MSQFWKAFPRRVAVVALLALLVGLPNDVQASHSAGFTYTMGQGSSATAITPLVGTKDIAAFYDYRASSAHTGLERANTSILFLYEDSNGVLSLVMIHDLANDGSGGKVTFGFTGIPAGTGYAVEDDLEAINDTDNFGAITAGTAAVEWIWFDCCTDGAALSGSLTSQAFSITISPQFTAGIGTWEFLTGDLANPTRILLTKNQSITIQASRSTIPVIIDIKPGGEPNCFNNNGQGAIPVAILSSPDFDATQVDPASVQLDGQGVKVVGKSNKLLAHSEDVNGDGRLDLVVQIEDQDGAYQPGDAVATLRGKLYNGTPIEGTDSICIVP